MSDGAKLHPGVTESTISAFSPGLAPTATLFGTITIAAPIAATRIVPGATGCITRGINGSDGRLGTILVAHSKPGPRPPGLSFLVFGVTPYIRLGKTHACVGLGENQSSKAQ